jgi:hypothetical protein
MKTAFVQSAFYAGYFIVAIPASLFIKKTSYKIGIMTGLAFFALGCFIFFVDRISASYPLSKVRETRVLTVYMIIGCDSSRHRLHPAPPSSCWSSACTS